MRGFRRLLRLKLEKALCHPGDEMVAEDEHGEWSVLGTMSEWAGVRRGDELDFGKVGAISADVGSGERLTPSVLKLFARER